MTWKPEKLFILTFWSSEAPSVLTLVDCDWLLSLTHRSAHPFKAAEHIWLVHVYVSKSKDAQLRCTNSIIHAVFHLSAWFPGERRLSCRRMSGCHTWTKSRSWDGRLSGGLSTSRCHDGPLRWWRLCAVLTDMVTTSAEIMNNIKQPSNFFPKCKQALIYVVSDANEVFMFFFCLNLY